MKYIRFFLTCTIIAIVAITLFWFDKFIRPLVPSSISTEIIQITAYIVLAVTLLTSFKDILELAERFTKSSRHQVYIPNIEEHPQNYPFGLLRDSVAKKVKSIWIDGFLENSLHNTVMIDLGIEYIPNAVNYPWNLIVRRPGYPKNVIQPGVKVKDVLEKLGGSLLILGEPGSGKTITLLDLTRDLYNQYYVDKKQPVPIVLNLSTWHPKYKLFMKWVAQEMNLVYRVNKEVCWRWFNSDSFYLVLDGLDEVVEEHRSSCIKAINQFHEEYGLVNIIISSRTADYQFLKSKLNLPGAIEIQPLDHEQISQYLSTGGNKLDAVRFAIQNDSVLQELAKTPLNLSIITFTYQRYPISNIQTGDINERRNRLFGDYVEVMFERRFLQSGHVKEKSLSVLAWLANQLSIRGSTLFFLEHIQPSWLPTKAERQYYLITTKMIGYLFYFGICMFFGWLLQSPTSGTIAGLVLGTTRLLFSNDDQLVTIEKLNIPRKPEGNIDFKPLCMGVLTGVFLISFLIAASSFWLIILIPFIPLMPNNTPINNLQGDVLPAIILTISLIGSTLIGFFSWIEYNQVENKTFVNQGVQLTAQNAIYGGILSGLFTYIISTLTINASAGKTLSILIGVLVMQFWGGNTVLNHFVLRMALYKYNRLPLRLVSFLNRMSDLILLRKLGGGYVFIHRSLMEYFAHQLPPDKEREILKSYQALLSKPTSGLFSFSGKFSKLILDYTLTLGSLVFLSPAMLVIAIVIKISSPGPIIHRRKVVGLNGKQFYTYKFRTMTIEGKSISNDNTTSDDKLTIKQVEQSNSPITRVGAFLIKFSLDELPQLFNVLKREMSLVGPRMISPKELASLYDINELKSLLVTAEK